MRVDTTTTEGVRDGGESGKTNLMMGWHWMIRTVHLHRTATREAGTRDRGTQRAVAAGLHLVETLNAD